MQIHATVFAEGDVPTFRRIGKVGETIAVVIETVKRKAARREVIEELPRPRATVGAADARCVKEVETTRHDAVDRQVGQVGDRALLQNSREHGRRRHLSRREG